MKSSRLLFLGAILIAVLQIGFLSWNIAGRAAVLRDGQEVLLKVQPVDPRDLLRGDYVRLGYDISTVSAALFVPALTGDGDYQEHPVWVLLRKQDDGYFGVKAAAFDRAALPPAEAGEAVIRGTAAGRPFAEGSTTVDYGLERFYLPEGEGRPIETDMRERPFSVVAAVADNGTAQIKRFLDGTTVLFEEPLY
ncbi:MAG: GDYXXLXY domain-containing protein [Mesorhizobium sp.]|nr:GDYXXLXY domain-containing protein [Mesorhizobium sp.]MCO5163628.1 GDYXXLXY domain-containing protein [Mesorhizobium sp.]